MTILGLFFRKMPISGLYPPQKTVIFSKNALFWPIPPCFGGVKIGVPLNIEPLKEKRGQKRVIFGPPPGIDPKNCQPVQKWAQSSMVLSQKVRQK